MVGEIISESVGGIIPERRATSAGMLEGSNRSRVTCIAANSARDLFEAGLNEAASVEHGLWALDQMRLIGTDIFHAEPIWWTIEMTAELRDRVDVVAASSATDCGPSCPRPCAGEEGSS
jgi:hypothetical protein